MTDNKTVRVRFAPSPTGALHIGGVTASSFFALKILTLCVQRKNTNKLSCREWSGLA